MAACVFVVLAFAAILFVRSEAKDEVATTSAPHGLAFVDNGKSIGEPESPTAARTLVSVDGQVNSGDIDDARNFALSEADPAVAIPVGPPQFPEQRAQIGGTSSAANTTGTDTGSQSAVPRVVTDEAVAGPPGLSLAPARPDVPSSPAPARSRPPEQTETTVATTSPPPSPGARTPEVSVSDTQAPALSPPASEAEPSRAAAPVTTSQPASTTTTTAASTTTTTEPPVPQRDAAIPDAIHVRAGSSGDGSLSRPLGSIREAIDRVRPGGTVLVHEGTYAGFNITKSGTPEAWITVAAASGERVIIDPTNYAGISMENVSHIEVRGFVVRGHNNSSGAGIRMANGAHSIRVIGNHVYDFPGNGIEAVEAGGVEIRGNRVHGNSRRSVWQTSGISLFQSKGPNNAGYDNVVAENIVYDNTNQVRSHSNAITDGNCIIVDYMIRHNYQGDFLIENNVCANNGGRGVHVFHSSNVLARNNTLYRNLTHPEINDGELTAIEASNVTFENNLIISSNGARDIHFWRVENATANNNMIVGERIDSSGGTNPSITDALLTNPNVAPSSTDFRPLSGSPALGEANGNTPLRDLGGTLRPPRAAIGALEQ